MNAIFAEQPVEGFAYNSSAGVYVKVITPSPCILELGKEYIVKWGDTEYSETAFPANINGYEMVAIGNKAIAGGDNTGESFAIAYNPTTDYLNLFAMTADASHNIAIYTSAEEIETPDEPEEPIEPEETTGVTITLYDRTGQAVNYNNVETITTDTPDAEQGATFTYGVAVENAEYEPDFADGNQKVTLEKGQLLKEFTITKPENLLPEHIKKNIEVAGVVGEFAGDEMEKTVSLNMADGDQVIEADEDTVLTKVTVIKPETLIPANIADGVNIGGIEGIHKDYSKEIIEGTAVSVANAQVSQIASYTFYTNKVMEKADFPNCKVIGDSAFMGCSALVDISFPNCETISGYSAFAACTSLPEAIFPKCTSLGTGSAFIRCLSLSNVEFPLCSSIPYGTFSSCPKLLNVSFPECTYIGTGAFYSCSGLEYIAMEKCISIGQSAFYMCTKLSSCSFPNVRDVHSMAFYGCTKLSQSSNYVYYVGDMAVYASSMFSSSTCSFREGTRVLAQQICHNKSRMTSVTGLENVEFIGPSAFYNCLSAQFGEFPDVKYIGNNAFYNCSKLSSVNASYCSTIKAGAFQCCSDLSYVYVPNVEGIEIQTFSSCSKLASFVAMKAKYISSYAFYKCSSLSRVFLPQCSYIGGSAFLGCSYLDTAILGELYSASTYVFQDCYRLMNLYLLGSSRLTNIPGFTNTPISKYSTYTGAYGSIFVRESLLDAYKKGWTGYSSRFVGMTDEEIAALYAEWGYTE